MTQTLTKVLSARKLSIKAQSIALAVATVSAVLLPQLLHQIGAFSGLGTKLGEVFLPMHLPIILMGLLAGPIPAATAGLISPLISFALSGMPSAAMLPFMMTELFIYGLAAGLLRNVKLPSVLKVLIAQIAGRVVRAVAILAAVNIFDAQGIKTAAILTSISVGLIGIILQLVIIPLVDYRLRND